MAFIGMEEKITAISHLRVTASWSGSSPRTEQATAIYNPPPGWVIKEHQVIVHSSNNGNREVSTLASGLSITTQQVFNEVYDAAFDFAAKSNNDELLVKLQEKKSEHFDFLLKYSTNKNTIQARIWAKAHGHQFDRKRGWEEVSVIATIIYLGTEDANSLASDIEQEFQMDIPNLGLSY